MKQTRREDFKIPQSERASSLAKFAPFPFRTTNTQYYFPLAADNFGGLTKACVNHAPPLADLKAKSAEAAAPDRGYLVEWPT